MSGSVKFGDDATLELYPGMLPQIMAQLHATLIMGPGKHRALVQGTSFSVWGHALLKKAAELDTPRYNIDELLEKGSSLPYELNSRLRLFSLADLVMEERVFAAAMWFNSQMGAGILWFLDNGYRGEILESRKALKLLGALPYVRLLDEIIQRLKFRGVDLSAPNAEEAWEDLPDRNTRKFEEAFKIFDTKWWNYWQDPAHSFESYVRRYVLAKIEVFRSRSGSASSSQAS